KSEKKSGISSIDDFSADAERFSLTYDTADKLQKMYMEGVFFQSPDFSLQATSLLTCALSWTSGQLMMDVDLKDNTILTLRYDQRVAKVTVDDEVTNDWKQDKRKGKLTLKL